MKLEIKAKIFDVSVMHFTANPATKNTFEFAVQEYLGNLVDSSSVESEALIAERVECLERLFLALINQLNDLNLYSIYQDIEKPLTQVLAKMEFEGVKLDVDFYQKLELDFSKQLEKLDIEIEKIAGEKINLRSPKQLSELLFERLNLPVIKKTKTGFSTDSEVLTELAAQKAHPIADLLLQYRELDKLLSTYIKALPKLVDYNSSRLHTTFQQTNAATGRLSSDHPNLQNIPIRTENGRLLRKGFVAEKGYCLVSADYSQVELRILAHCSEDPIMLDTFARDLDIHTQTAAEIFNIPLDKVTKAQRSSAKAINFGLMYGQSSFGLSKALGISRAEAKDYITFYFERFSQVKAYLDSLRERCEKLGYAETLFGRKRFLPDINSKNRTVKAMAERVAINSPIQGTAADIIKMAMIKVDKRLKRENLEAKLILQVHDELIIEAPNGEVETIKDLLKQEMESAAQLKVKLQVDVSAGENWYDLK
jgi:DNA polymerase-1